MFESTVQILATAILSVGGSWAIVYFVARRSVKYVDSYLDTKAKNLATHEDIIKLVDQVRETEKVKAEITDSVWDRQQRWTAKHAMYRDLIESLIALQHAALAVNAMENNNDPALATYRIEYLSSLKRIQALQMVAAISVSQNAFEIWRQFATGTPAFSDTHALADNINEVIASLAWEARNDLGYPAFKAKRIEDKT